MHSSGRPTIASLSVSLRLSVILFITLIRAVEIHRAHTQSDSPEGSYWTELQQSTSLYDAFIAVIGHDVRVTI